MHTKCPGRTQIQTAMGLDDAEYDTLLRRSQVEYLTQIDFLAPEEEINEQARRIQATLDPKLQYFVLLRYRHGD